MGGLCTSNRLEGNTLYYKGTLTSCFEDTVLLPIFSWIFCLTLLALFALSRQRHFSSSESWSSFDSPSGTPRRKTTKGGIQLANLTPADHEAGRASRLTKRLGLRVGGGDAGGKRLSSTGPVKRRRIVLGVYVFFLVVNIAMTTLEIARLSASARGIGLLPFVYLPLLLALGSLFLRPHSYPLLTCFSIYFAVMAVVLGVKTRSLAVFRDTAFKLTVDQTASFDKYGYPDWILDNGVMAGVYGILFFCEIVQTIFDRRTS